MTRIGVGWSTYFERPGKKPWQYKRLRYAYRAPSLFLQGMLAAGADVELVQFDENLTRADFGTSGPAQQVDILYVATHGMNPATGFELGLFADDWPLIGSGFGTAGPPVVIFDACNLADPKAQGWDSTWRTDKLGLELRLVLGFTTQASVSRRASIRGTAFAQELQNQPIADAWTTSIQAGAYTGTDKALAIALGEDDADAKNVLDNTWITALPGPRTNLVPGLAWKP